MRTLIYCLDLSLIATQISIVVESTFIRTVRSTDNRSLSLIAVVFDEGTVVNLIKVPRDVTIQKGDILVFCTLPFGVSEFVEIKKPSIKG
jgi:hypothetical protein